MWKKMVGDYFLFSRKERNGIIALLILIAAITAAPYIFPLLIAEKQLPADNFTHELASLVQDTASAYITRSRQPYVQRGEYSKSSPQGALFTFDPNTATLAEWMQLGVREKTAHTIQKYIQKGGKFYKPADIKKIWGLHPKLAERLMPYVSIAVVQTASGSAPQPVVNTRKIYNERTIAAVDINVADTNAWKALPGIGSKLSQRIVSFRDKLGGFYTVDQVSEVYLLPDSTFEKIRPHLVLQTRSVKMININKATLEELKLHPYLRYPLANAIISYRLQHGNFSSVADIKKIMIITDDIYAKISPYLSVN